MTCRHAAPLVSCVALATVLLAPAPPPPARASARATLEQADSLYWSGEPRRSLELIEAYLGERPREYEAHWRGARAALSAGLLDGDRSEQRRWLDRGVAHGEEAVRLSPDGVDGLYWLTANIGCRSFLLSLRGSARAAQRVYDLSNRVLALDPRHAGAHDALGKLAYRVMRLSALERLLAKALLGDAALRSASWETAELHLRRAVELDPTWLMPHLDLGMAYLHTGRYELAQAELERALGLPPRHPGDLVFQKEAADAVSYARARHKP